MNRLAIAMLLGMCACIEIEFPQPTPSPTESPAPTPEPTPTATATPTPAPEPSPLPSPVLCEIHIPTEPVSCEFGVPGLEFEAEFVEAQRVAAENGFVTNGVVNDEVEYTRELARIIRVSGRCAISGADFDGGPPDEVWIRGNGFTAHWDGVSGSDGSPIAHPAARCVPEHF